jgi:hypothetical protein
LDHTCLYKNKKKKFYEMVERSESSSRLLSQLVFGQERVDPLFYKIYTKTKKTENSSFKETSLHALRAVITQAGDKMSEPIRKSILASLQSKKKRDRPPPDVLAPSSVTCPPTNW